MIAAILFFVLLVGGSHSWRLNATPMQVHFGRAENATLTCRHHADNTDNTQPRMNQVARMMILKAGDDPERPWTTYAKVYDAHRPALLVRPGGDGVTALGLAGQVNQSYLSVTWKRTTNDTAGTYRCHVDGYTDQDRAVHFSSPNISLAMAPQSLKDILTSAFDFERRSQEIHEQGISLLKSIENRFGRTQWPEGKFTLLKADEGCPKTSNAKWLDGYVRFHTESSHSSNGNSVSDPSHMAKPVMQKVGDANLFYMQTCTQDADWPSTAPAWPKGKYCILKSQAGGLPDNFSNATIYFDAEDSEPRFSEQSTGPRTSIISGDFKLAFGCRDDGDPSSPIELPVETPFFLFRTGGRCQEVINAKVSEETFTVDSEDGGNADSTEGPIGPDGSINPLQLQTCYYQKIVY